MESSPQREFFDRFAEPLSKAPAEDRPRLSRQCRRILEMLQAGPKTNGQLAEVALKYTGRISELRQAGYTIACRPIGGGLTEYDLQEPQHPNHA